jgi:amidase
VFFDAALERARQLDKHFEEHRSPIGPLHGLPVSLKDQFHVKGVETTMGYVGWIGTFEGKKGTGLERNTNSQLVDELLSLGAVLYCKVGVLLAEDAVVKSPFLTSWHNRQAFHKRCL